MRLWPFIYHFCTLKGVICSHRQLHDLLEEAGRPVKGWSSSWHTDATWIVVVTSSQLQDRTTSLDLCSSHSSCNFVFPYSSRR